MHSFQKTIERSLGLALALMLSVSSIFAQQSGGTLRGQVTDEFGASIVGATVTVTDNSGAAVKTATTNGEGAFALGNLVPGKYTVRATAGGFALYENTDVNIAAGRRESLDIKLSVALENLEVTIAAESALSTEPENNADALVLRGSDIEALPDDPDELAEALQALAGPSAGPNGGQIFIDGFSGGRLPPRDSIREIRVNQNPFTAENDRPGGGRIEILTKPGTDKLRGNTYFTFMDESLNSRNPFLATEKRPPFQVRRYGGNLSGSIIPKRASFFLDFERNEDDENDIINARVLDPVTLEEGRFSQAVLTPQRRTEFNPRFDYQINAANTFIARYTYSTRDNENSGISEFTLPSRAFNTSNTQHILQLTETAVINQKVVNETRFQYIRGRSRREGDSSLPAINVQGAFLGGGSQVGLSLDDDDRYELQNYTSWTLGAHSLKAGGRLRSVRLLDVSPQNFGGTFVFTSLDQYRNVLQGVPGARPTQFTISGGDPEASVTQTDFGGFIQDDWRMRPDLTVSFGLRYETQNNINSHLNFAPRVAFAYSPGAGGQSGQQARTVIRAGFGLFYDRFSENLTLQANRFNGVNQQRFIVDNRTPTGQQILSSVIFNRNGTVANVPAISSLTALPQTRQIVAEDLQAPSTYFAGLNIERQLPKNISAFVGFSTIRARHVLRLRNINAPLPGTFNFDSPGQTTVRPLGNIGDILQYESSGVSNFNQMFIGFRSRLNRNLSISVNYNLAKAESDAEGGFGGGGIASPANPYDFSNEYGRASSDIRHRFFLIGSVAVPMLKLQLNPFITAFSGRPFNITTGLDTNGDGLFTERPAFATSSTDPRFLRRTIYGDFDLRPATGQEIIPRNFGEGPGYFSVNLRITRVFGFGDVPGARAAAVASQQGGGQAAAGAGGAQSASGGGPRDGGGGRGDGGGGGRGSGRGFSGGGGGPFGGGSSFGGSEKRYNISLSLQITNLFNRVNAGQPISNLSSRDFGISLNPAGGSGGFGRGDGGGGGIAAGNRRLQAQVRFTF